jgi:predicted nucleic-acid-binding protein
MTALAGKLPIAPVLARFLVDDADDVEAAKQRPAAVAALSERALITVTVLLELEGVLRGFYGLRRADIARALRALAGIEHIVIEDRDAVLAALDAFDAGLDFADALHLARSARASSFASFDKALARRAKRLAVLPRVELLG